MGRICDVAASNAMLMRAMVTVVVVTTAALIIIVVGVLLVVGIFTRVRAPALQLTATAGAATGGSDHSLATGRRGWWQRGGCHNHRSCSRCDFSGSSSGLH